MELALYEDSPRYDLWLKLLLGFAPALTFFLGLLLYYGALPNETEEEARTGAVVLLAATALCLVLYWAFLPRRFIILEDRLKIKHGAFSLNIPFDTIKEAKVAKGLSFFTLSSVTSVESQVEIVRKRGFNVRISPSHRDLFLENLNKALLLTPR